MGFPRRNSQLFYGSKNGNPLPVRYGLAYGRILTKFAALKVFISYTHDSKEHDTMVLDLSNTLRETAGIDSDIDQYHANQNWPRWMEEKIDWADKVLVICTETYLRRWKNQEKPGEGLGAQYESLLTRQDLYEGAGDNEKFVPVVFDAHDLKNIPKPLRSVTRVVLGQQMDGFNSLLNRIFGRPPADKPVIALSPILRADGFFLNPEGEVSERIGNPSCKDLRESNVAPDSIIKKFRSEDAQHQINSGRKLSISRQETRAELEREWLRSSPIVGLLQGFPGSGKTNLASSLVSDGLTTLDPIQVGEDSEDREMDLLMNLVTSLEANGFDEMAKELDKGEQADPLAALQRLIRRERVLVTIDEFQRLFLAENTRPPENWQRFIEGLNNATSSAGKLLLISNRIVSPDRWNEGCVVKNIKKLTDPEAADFLLERLIDRDLRDRVPQERLVEIGKRLGGNPRALQTLVGSLVHFSLDELITTIPKQLETGDVRIESQLLEEFERQLISRAIDHLNDNEIRFMRWLAVNRNPISSAFYPTISDEFPQWKQTRRVMIDRFLLEAKNFGDVMHPLAREIAVTRLREDGQGWRNAHGRAADYHLDLFEFSGKRFDRIHAASFSDLRHHLFESGRLDELSKVSARMRSFVLSRIAKPTHSKVPRSTEILEEHIVLIESLPEAERTKGLEYHLALCLRERNGANDYEKALLHAKKAIGQGVYYAVWLLLADLEFTLNGSEALKSAAARALDSLGSGSNAFAIYHHCADLLDKDGRTREAIAFLEKGIKTPGVECKSSLIVMCVRFLDQIGDKQKASELLACGLEDGGLKEEGIVFAKWASRLTSEGQHEEAILLLERAIARKGITKLFSLYLIKSRALMSLGRVECALKTLREGIGDKRVIDPVLLFRQLAELLARQGDIDAAVDLLQSAVSHPAIRDIAPLFHSTAGILEAAGEFDLGARLLAKALDQPKLQNDHNMYLACAKMHFRARNLELALSILKRGLGRPRMRERNQLIIKVAEITHRMGLTKEAIGILRDSIENESDPRHLGKIYHYCAELLGANGDLVGGEEVLRKGVAAPAIADKTVLVQALAKNLAKQNRSDEAVRLLKDSVTWPGIPGAVILYQTCATILSKSRRLDEAITLLQEGMKNKSLGNLGSLFTQCAELLLMVNKHSEAIELLQRGVDEFPKDQSIKDLRGRMMSKRRR